MIGQELAFELEMANTARPVKVCIQINGITEHICGITQVHTGPENDSIYICIDDPSFLED